MVGVDIRAWGWPWYLSGHGVVYQGGCGSYQDMEKSIGVGVVAIRT